MPGSCQEFGCTAHSYDPMQVVHDEYEYDDYMQDTATLSKLPDELISCCLSGLSASDMACLESVNQRMRYVVQNDSARWREVVLERWGNELSRDILDASSTLAGSWKRLFSEKMMVDKANLPWRIPCSSEMDALLDAIQNRPQKTTQMERNGMKVLKPQTMKNNSGAYPFSQSPVSIMQDSNMMNDSVEESDSNTGKEYEIAVMVLIDGSSSVTEDDFRAMRRFARSTVCSLNLCERNAAFGVIQFNQIPRVELALSDITSEKVLETVDKLEQMMGSTDIAAPVKRAVQLLAEVQAHDKVMILLTDGQTHSEEIRQTQIQAVRGATDYGLRMFALGVGRDVDEVGLGRVVSAVRTAHVESTGNDSPNSAAYYAIRKYVKPT
eukprot:CAMPEP_0182445284 /NCGR_PEP_ID=MMETSP1172-20130603/3456_1 /TAXON_ID=708627 /ORGANISM="Timspurckia oligopyrenoides, Strain CCMP3278" /LENGTH=380 /DNA_ID=CAMNT_0024641021 /DNA_START=164 /DNA_END=1306 /DNA_ORIENTATION=+